MEFVTRLAVHQDIPAITRIYNQGIEDRIATLEVETKTEQEMMGWLSHRREAHKVVVITGGSDQVQGWASLNLFSSRCCYSGVVDISIYVERSMRGKGLGKMLLAFLQEVAVREGFQKLVLSTLSYNEIGRRLYFSQGFREVGTYEKQGLLDGKWVDVTIMEKIL